jgi:hypothetical protein
MTQPKLKWTIPDSSQILELPHENLRSWVQNEYVKPDYPAAGKGSKHYLSEKNLIQAKTFEYLVRQGVLKNDAKEVIKQFGRYDPDRPFLHIFKDGDKIRVKWFAKVQQNKKSFAMLIVLDISDIVKKVEASMIKHQGEGIQLS